MIGEQDDWTPNKGEGELRRGRRGRGGGGGVTEEGQLFTKAGAKTLQNNSGCKCASSQRLYNQRKALGW